MKAWAGGHENEDLGKLEYKKPAQPQLHLRRFPVTLKLSDRVDKICRRASITSEGRSRAGALRALTRVSAHTHERVSAHTRERVNLQAL